LWLSTNGRQHATIAVRACSDVHIALTTRVGNITQGREIVIGGYDNSLSLIIDGVRDIDSSFGGSVVAEQETPQILSCTEWRMFWISWIDDLLEVGTGWELGAAGFMRWYDASPVAIAAIGVSTGYSHDGDWSLTHTRGYYGHYLRGQTLDDKANCLLEQLVTSYGGLYT
jgi:Farnesoic acid 0-methyl transferase